MERLWAPWRLKYIKAKKAKKCILCNSLKFRKKSYVIFKNKLSFAVLNIYPYNNGHIMVSPIRHVREISKLKDREILDLFHTLTKTKVLLDKILKPDGYNIGMNTSASAGAGEAGHLHIHIVPRWKGDTNFMTTISNTKIISQSLDELLRQLREAQTYGTK